MNFVAAERRREPRDAPNGEPQRDRIYAMITGMYREMPGLSLHAPQAARLFGLRADTCQLVLDSLVARGVLRRRTDGQYAAH